MAKKHKPKNIPTDVLMFRLNEFSHQVSAQLQNSFQLGNNFEKKLLLDCPPGPVRTALQTLLNAAKTLSEATEKAGKPLIQDVPFIEAEQNDFDPFKLGQWSKGIITGTVRKGNIQQMEKMIEVSSNGFNSFLLRNALFEKRRLNKKRR